MTTPIDDAAPRVDHHARPWRLAVIGSVAVLAVAIGLGVAAFLTVNRAAAVGAGAEYVPAGAALYLEVRLEPSADQDAALRDLLARFPPIDGVDLDRPLADQLAELLDEALTDEELDVSWSEDVAPWTDGRLALAVLELPAETLDPVAGPTSMEDAPPMVALLGVTDAAAARGAIDRILADTDAPRGTPTEHRGVTIHATDEGAYAITDDQLILAPSVDDVMTALDAHADGPTLGAGDTIAPLVEALPDDWLAFGVFDFTEAMSTALEGAGADSGAEADAMARILEHQTLRAAFTVRATDEGLAFETAGTAPTGPFAVRNVDRDLAASVPGDALYYAEGGSIGTVLAEIIAALKDVAEGEPEAADGIRTAEAALGADLEELVSWIDDGALAIGWDGSEPYAGLVLTTTDVSAAERRLEQLATFAGLAAMDPSSGITVTEDEVDGVSVTTIAVGDVAVRDLPMVAPTGLSVQYAVTDEDRVLVGIGERFVGAVIGLERGASLASVPRYADAIDALGGPEHAGATWVDLAGIVEAVEGFAGPMLGEGESDEALAWLRPFDRLVTVARLEDELLVQRSVLRVR